MNSALVRRLISDDITSKRAKKKKLLLWENTIADIESGKKLSCWDVQFGFLKYYKSYLTIVPKFSLASNIGIGEGSTHAVNAGNSMPSIFLLRKRILAKSSIRRLLYAIISTIRLLIINTDFRIR